MAVTLTKSNARIGAAKVTFNSQQLGMLDSAEVTVDGKTIPLKCDQWADQVLDEIITAKEATIKLGLKECNIENLVNVFGDWTVVTSPSKYCYFETNIGDSLYSYAHTLVIERLSDPLTERSAEDKLTFTYAVPFGPMVEKYSFSNYQVYEVTFKVFVDITTGRLGYRGTTS